MTHIEPKNLAAPTETPCDVPVVSQGDLWQAFGRIGLLSFGGPAAQIALMQREIVDDRKWIDQESFLRGLGFCMLLPGPEAMQLATYIGWRLQGVVGGLFAGGLFVLPGAFVIALLSAIYISFGTEPLVQSAFLGIKAAVLAIVLGALIKLSKKALEGTVSIILAGTAFVALFVFGLPFPLVVLAAGVFGAVTSATSNAALPSLQSNHGHLLRTTLTWGGLWALPLVALALTGQGLLFDLALFFGQLAITTFGGAYAVLAYMTQEIVQNQAWITADQMIDALGLAETTPGPLILVTQFVGHLAGFGQAGWGLWFAAGIVTLWMTFIPCFLWIFAGAPYLEALTARPRIASALKAITAAIVGVMANLALWFALNVLFDDVREVFVVANAAVPVPDLLSLNLVTLACFGVAVFGLIWRAWSVPLVLAGCACFALALTALGL